MAWYDVWNTSAGKIHYTMSKLSNYPWQCLVQLVIHSTFSPLTVMIVCKTFVSLKLSSQSLGGQFIKTELRPAQFWKNTTFGWVIMVLIDGIVRFYCHCRSGLPPYRFDIKNAEKLSPTDTFVFEYGSGSVFFRFCLDLSFDLQPGVCYQKPLPPVLLWEMMAFSMACSIHWQGIYLTPIISTLNMLCTHFHCTCNCSRGKFHYFTNHMLE